MNNPAYHAVRVVISGRVQGVGFRNWTQKKAQKLGLQGWVRNLDTGEVEAVFAGEPAVVEAMISACAKGPLTAKVQRIDTFPHSEELPHGFTRLPNA